VLLRLAAALLTVSVLVAGCGAPDDETTPPVVTTTLPPELPTDLPQLPVGTGDIGPGDHVRARGSVLHVDGRSADLAPLRIGDHVVVKGGVYFLNGSELWFTDLGRARATGYEDVRSLVASPHGTRLAFLDLQHGPKDRDGTPLAISIAYDARTGTPLVASYAGMGDVTTDDLSQLYQQDEPRIVGFAGDDLVVHGATGKDLRIPLTDQFGVGASG
jgi:hypothetical protein